MNKLGFTFKPGPLSEPGEDARSAGKSAVAMTPSDLQDPPDVRQT